MKPDKPLLILPISLHNIDKDKNKQRFITKLHTPTPQCQYNRVHNKINDILESFRLQELQLSVHPNNVDLEYIIVFELFGSIDNFYKQVKNIGMEWLFEEIIDECEPNSDFYYEDEKGQTNKKITDKIYCVSSNKHSLKNLMQLWKNYSENMHNKTKENGFASIRDMLLQIKNIRRWDVHDRIEGTGLLDYLNDAIDEVENKIIEIELFYRMDIKKRVEIANSIKEQIKTVNGKVLQECIIEDIRYHCILVQLPRQYISSIVDKYNDCALFNIDGIMYIRPTCQSYFEIVSTNENSKDNIINEDNISDFKSVSDEPIIALLDGLPMANHFILNNKLIIDDPDAYEDKYEVDYRRHGTSMASYIIHGDLNKKDKSINSKLYVRPILKPCLSSINPVEKVPEDVILVDLIHKAVKRIFDELKYPIKVINFSIGDPNRPFMFNMSPLGRLLDYLSHKYNVLFVISAGNNKDFLVKMADEVNNLESLNMEDRTVCCTELMIKYSRNFRVISPAESINNLSVGAIFDDFCETDSDGYNTYFPLYRGMPSPFSYIGYGFNSSVKPDLFYYGGRCMIRTHSKYSISNIYMKEPGGKSALAEKNSINKFLYSMGTSDAAAQITHEIGKCYESLSAILPENNFDVAYESIILKAMIAHSASYLEIEDKLKKYFKLSGKRGISKYIGYGIPDTNRVLECTATRITFIGYNEILSDKKDVYVIPLPIDLATKKIKRKLIVTLAYFTPINVESNTYKQVNIEFKLSKTTKDVFYSYTETQSHIKKGTLQHVIYYGDKTIPNFNQNIEIEVTRKDNQKYNDPVRYAMLITVEFTDGIEANTDIYSKIKQLLQVKVDKTKVSVI